MMNNIGRFGARAAQQLSRSPASQNMARGQFSSTAGKAGNFAKQEFSKLFRDEAMETGGQLVSQSAGLEIKDHHQTSTMKILNSLDYSGAKSALDNLSKSFDQSSSLEGRIFSSLDFGN